MNIGTKALFDKLPQDNWKSLTYRKNRAWSFYARNGKLELFRETHSNGYRVEVFHQGAIAYGCTSSALDLGKQYEDTLALAKLSAKYKLHHFDIEDIRPKSVGEWQGSETFSFSKSEFKNLSDQCIESSEIMRNCPQIQSSQSYYIIEEVEMEMVNSSGSHTRQRYLIMMDSSAATAANADDSQTRSNGNLVGQDNLFKNWQAKKERLQIMADEAKQLLLAPNCENRPMDLILSPDQLYLQIHESIGHPLELDRILGDERNYAGWSFLGTEDFGKLQYGSKLLNITFDPTVATELASYGFDETGIKASKEYLIKDGKLLRSLGSLESQVRSGVPGVANFRSTAWNRAPIDRMANINMEPGESSLEQMMASVEDGIYMQTNKSWSIDDYRNKFQFSCEFARRIKNGKLTEVVKNPNYRGKCLEFWNNLAMVGNKSTYEICGSFFCGKGEPNQVIRVGHATPHALFQNVDVFGGE